MLERNRTSGASRDGHDGSTQFLLAENKQLRDDLAESYRKLETVARELELSLAVRKNLSEVEVQLKIYKDKYAQSETENSNLYKENSRLISDIKILKEQQKETEEVFLGKYEELELENMTQRKNFETERSILKACIEEEKTRTSNLAARTYTTPFDVGTVVSQFGVGNLQTHPSIELEAQIASARSDLKQREKELYDLRLKYESLLLGRDVISGVISSAQKLNEVEYLRNENEKLTEEIMELKNKKSPETSDELLTKVEAALEVRYRGEIQRLRALLTSVEGKESKKENSSVNPSIEKVVAENEFLKEELDKLQKKLSINQEELQKLNAKYSAILVRPMGAGYPRSSFYEQKRNSFLNETQRSSFNQPSVIQPPADESLQLEERIKELVAENNNMQKTLKLIEADNRSLSQRSKEAESSFAISKIELAKAYEDLTEAREHSTKRENEWNERLKTLERSLIIKYSEEAEQWKTQYNSLLEGGPETIYSYEGSARKSHLGQGSGSKGNMPTSTVPSSVEILTKQYQSERTLWENERKQLLSEIEFKSQRLEALENSIKKMSESVGTQGGLSAYYLDENKKLNSELKILKIRSSVVEEGKRSISDKDLLVQKIKELEEKLALYKNNAGDIEKVLERKEETIAGLATELEKLRLRYFIFIFFRCFKKKALYQTI
jgi:hypothetical protein